MNAGILQQTASTVDRLQGVQGPGCYLSDGSYMFLLYDPTVSAATALKLYRRRPDGSRTLIASLPTYTTFAGGQLGFYFGTTTETGVALRRGVSVCRDMDDNVYVIGCAAVDSINKLVGIVAFTLTGSLVVSNPFTQQTFVTETTSTVGATGGGVSQAFYVYYSSGGVEYSYIVCFSPGSRVFWFMTTKPKAGTNLTTNDVKSWGAAVGGDADWTFGVAADGFGSNSFLWFGTSASAMKLRKFILNANTTVAGSSITETDMTLTNSGSQFQQGNRAQIIRGRGGIFYTISLGSAGQAVGIATLAAGQTANASTMGTGAKTNYPALGANDFNFRVAAYYEPATDKVWFVRAMDGAEATLPNTILKVGYSSNFNGTGGVLAGWDATGSVVHSDWSDISMTSSDFGAAGGFASLAVAEKPSPYSSYFDYVVSNVNSVPALYLAINERMPLQQGSFPVSLLTPANFAYTDLATGPTFTWDYVGPEPSQYAYAIMRSISDETGVTAFVYWNALRQAWGPVNRIFYNESAVESVVFPANVWANHDTSYLWGVKVSDVPLSAFFTVTGLAKPVVAVTAPVSPVTTTDYPTVTWSYGHEDGLPWELWQIKVFSAAEYGIGGFDPDVSPNTWESGWRYDATQSWPIGAELGTTTYRAYVQTKTKGVLSPWAYIQWTQNVTRPSAPTLVATADNALKRVALVATHVGTWTAGTIAQFEYSDDGGVTWSELLDSGQAAYVGAGPRTATTYDYSSPPNSARQYRVRSVLPASGPRSTPSGTASATVVFGMEVWLKAIGDPTKNIHVPVENDWQPITSHRAKATFEALGAEKPIVLTGDIRYDSFKLRFTALDTDFDAVTTFADYDGLKLVQTQRRQWFVDVSESHDVSEALFDQSVDAEARLVELTFTEVDASA